jgi:hypothetical protein
MPAQYVTSIVEGQDFYVADIDPTGVVSAPRGSVCLRVDAGNALVYYNATVANSPGTTWVPLLSTDLTDITQLILAANANPALQIGPAATLDLLKFVTTTGAAQVLVNTSQAALTLTGGFGINLTGASATFSAVNKDALDIAKNAASQGVSSQGLGAIVTAEYAVPANSSGGNVDTNFVLTTTRSVSVIDAYVVSSGTAAGSVQLRTTGSGITDAMVPGGPTVNTLTRATVMAANTLAAGATLVVRTATGTAAGNIVRVTFKVA